MDPESRKLLEESLRLSQDNNRILHSMKRSLFWAHFMSTIYWLFIIGSAVGAYFYIQPYLGRIESMYTSASSVLNNFKQ